MTKTNIDPCRERKRLIMIMGVQRSGTTALFYALATAPGVTARHESDNDEIYTDWFLRPEPENRSFLASLPGTVLLKPVRESERRSPKALAEEYANYDLKIIWLYRDPVNVFDSYARRGWTASDQLCALHFAEMWRQRNMEAISDARSLKGRLTFVRYEDLVSDPELLSQFGHLLGLRVKARLGGDSALGRKNQSADVCRMIDRVTNFTRAQLDELRSIRPSTLLFETTRDATTPRFKSEPDVVAIAEYLGTFSAEDHSARHARWLKAGPLRHDETTGAFVSLGYKASREILARSRPLSEAPELSMDFELGDKLEHFFSLRRRAITESIATAIDSWLHDLPLGKSFDMHERLVALAMKSAGIWLGISGQTTALVLEMARGVHVSTNDADCSPAQVELHSTLLQRGLAKELCAAGLLKPETLSGFLADAAMPLFGIPAVVCNALVAIAAAPGMLDFCRTNPAVIPAVFSEAMRLVPLWFSVRRQMTGPLRFADINIPHNATVEVFLATANRDPSVFEQPCAIFPERSGPPPLLLDNNRAAFTRLAVNPAWGTGHILFDVSAMVLQKLLTLPQPLEFRATPRTAVLPMPSGDLLQVPRELPVRMSKELTY